MSRNPVEERIIVSSITRADQTRVKILATQFRDAEFSTASQSPILQSRIANIPSSLSNRSHISHILSVVREERKTEGGGERELLWQKGAFV